MDGEVNVMTIQISALQRTIGPNWLLALSTLKYEGAIADFQVQRGSVLIAPNLTAEINSIFTTFSTINEDQPRRTHE